MRLSLNDSIRVKLTDFGKDIYYHQYDRLNNEFGRQICKPSMPKVDEDGYTTFQLWCFMELYGVHMGMTWPNVIEPLDLVFDAPTIEPERKTGEWIPCSERLPEKERKTYWVCTDVGSQHECRWTNNRFGLWKSTDDWGWSIFDIPQYTSVIAWMPLPEPYKGGDTNG